MAKVKITEEEANQAYLDGYNEGRGSSCLLEDIVDGIVDDIKEVADGVFDEFMNALTFGLWIVEDEKEQRLQEIYDAGYQKGQEDKEKYGELD